MMLAAFPIKDTALPILDHLLTLLDSLRMDALQAKIQERVLLAALVTRCGNMSESFSNAYVSALIRAGEAVGHEDVCEIGQDEECRASTMLPFDFFYDSSGVWEEPCRPPHGYYPGVTGDELRKRAHARSVIQKSMKRLQNRLGLKGGISDGGPYFPMSPMSSSAPSPTALTTPTVPPLVRTNSSSLKRKGSQIQEPSVVAGGVGIPDTIFNPGHFSVPMIWDFDDVANFPYGRHNLGYRPSILTVGGGVLSENKRRKLSLSTNDRFSFQDDSPTLVYRITHEIEWEDVANMFLHGVSTRILMTKH